MDEKIYFKKRGFIVTSEKLSSREWDIPIASIEAVRIKRTYSRKVVTVLLLAVLCVMSGRFVSMHPEVTRATLVSFLPIVLCLIMAAYEFASPTYILSVKVKVDSEETSVLTGKNRLVEPARLALERALKDRQQTASAAAENEWREGG